MKLFIGKMTIETALETQGSTPFLSLPEDVQETILEALYDRVEETLMVLANELHHIAANAGTVINVTVEPNANN